VKVAYHFVCFKLLQYAVELDVLVLFNHDEGDCLIDRLTLCEQHFQAYDCAQFFVISIWVLLELTQEVLPSMCLVFLCNLICMSDSCFGLDMRNIFLCILYSSAVSYTG
jgi:hypothetical protein